MFHLDDDHGNWTLANLVAACPLCHGTQNIGSPTANQDLTVIWMPEVEQPVLNVLVRGIHLMLHRHDVATTLTPRHMPNEPELVAAWRAYAALDARKADAERVLDSYHPLDLARALAAMAPDEYDRRETLLGGLRLLHRGQRLRRGRDVYPAQLAAWAKLPSTSPRSAGGRSCPARHRSAPRRSSPLGRAPAAPPW